MNLWIEWRVGFFRVNLMHRNRSNQRIVDVECTRTIKGKKNMETRKVLQSLMFLIQSVHCIYNTYLHRSILKIVLASKQNGVFQPTVECVWWLKFYFCNGFGFLVQFNIRIRFICKHIKTYDTFHHLYLVRLNELTSWKKKLDSWSSIRKYLDLVES